MSTESDAEHLSERIGPFRISPADKAALEALAQRNERQVAGEVRLAIKARLEQEGKQ